MKRMVFFSLLTVVILFFNSNEALAQTNDCNDYGAGYDCYSVSNDNNIDSDYGSLTADGSLFWVYVHLWANHPTDAVASAEISTNAGYWTHTISDGDYENEFTVAGDGPGGSVSLYTSARYGQAFIYASW